MLLDCRKGELGPYSDTPIGWETKAPSSPVKGACAKKRISSRGRRGKARHPGPRISLCLPTCGQRMVTSGTHEHTAPVTDSSVC